MHATKSVALVAFASGAFAIPGLRHGHYHPRSYSANGISGVSSQASIPYPLANSTIAIVPTGTGVPTQLSSSSVSVSTTASISSRLTAISSSIPSETVPANAYTVQSSVLPSGTSVAIPATISAAAQHGEDTDDDESCIPIDTTITVTTEIYITVDAHDSSELPETSTSTPPAKVTPSTTVAKVTSTVIPSSSYTPSATSIRAAFVPSFAASDFINMPSHPVVSSQPVVVSVSSTPAAVVPTSHSVIVSISSSSIAAAPSATKSYSSGGKRGLAYNDVKLTQCFAGNSKISWAYNWASSGGDGLPEGITFIPTLWGTAPEFTSVWDSSAKAAIANGATHLMSFNEPDHPKQANLAPDAAAAAYRQYMQPFAGQGVKLGAPSVTNGGGQMGLTWLSNFLTSCDDCHIDFINIHWYDSASNIQYFKNHIQDAIKIANGRPIYVSEFGCTSGSDSDISNFLQTVMPWMDSLAEVEGYAYFMVSDGSLVTGNEPSGYGSTYATFAG